MSPTLTEQRSANLRRALEVSIVGDATLLPTLYTDDVHGWSPALLVSSRAELADELQTRAGAFTDVVMSIAPVDITDGKGYAEWAFAATHTGPFVIDDDDVIHPTGRRVTLRGMTVAEFDGARIKAFRQYWDEIALLEGLGLLPED
ncbi:MAG TPA: ester cyclase [Acidimicrobiia bacterium]|nr:ester cyclase [Acidimicrobiia bacterium]